MTIKSRAKLFLISLVALTTLVGSPLAVYAGYSPANRPTYQCITPTNCPGADHVVFNSFTNAPNYGDERAFFDGKNSGDTSTNGYLDSINVHDGQKLTLRVYIHNNANPNAIGKAAATAHNTSLQVLLPREIKNSSFAAANVGADNATPGTVSDTVDFRGDSPFSVTFDKSLPPQITYRQNGAGDWVTRNVLNANMSDNYLNASFGDWDGCFNYSALVTMTVIVKMPTTPPPPAYSCDAFNITADVNRNVKITTFNTSASNGAVFKNGTVNWGDNSDNLTDANLVGKSHQYSKDGTYKITATANFTVNGKDVSATSVNCAKDVTFTSEKPPVVTPPTTPPTTLVNTGPGQVAGIFAAVTAAGTLGYRRILSRKLSRQ